MAEPAAATELVGASLVPELPCGDGIGGDKGDGVGIGRGRIRANGGGRRDGGGHFFHGVLELLFALVLQQAAGDAQRDGEQRDERDERGVGQRRGAHEAAVADELPDDEHPEMHEAFEPAFEQENFVFGTAGGTGKDFDEAGKPFAGHGAGNANKVRGQVNGAQRLYAGGRKGTMGAVIRSSIG